ncbi:MAG: selenide, water dikinase SelD [Thermoanaerobaculia bacterium]
MRRPTRAHQTDLVLVGGGHSHVQVLESFAMEPPPDTRIALVVDRPDAMYSGMVPGFVAGQYEQSELEIDVLPLARRIGARVVLARANRIDAIENRIHLDGRPPIPFDFASINVGSTVAGLSTPGVRENAIATRPIGRFVSRLDALFADMTERAPAGTVRVLVVGAGAGGVELAFALDQRLRTLGGEVEVSLVEAGPEILPGYSSGMRDKALEAARRNGIRVLTGYRVTRAERGTAWLEREGAEAASKRTFDLLLWVTGAVSHSLFRDSDLPTDERGFVKVRSTLQLEEHDHVFAVGDCSTMTGHPDTPKAGVYAVRQGPVLAVNLRRLLAGGTLLERYRPQHDFLTLINTGDGSAIGGKWFLSFEGDWVFKLKDHIDRKFMLRFQPLDHPGRPTAFDTDAMAGDGDEAGDEMLCGGCAAKLGQLPLERALARLPAEQSDDSVELGLEDADDAAVARPSGGVRIVSSVDQFRAFTDDPFLVGRVAAVNAASDIFAKGVTPRYAHALVALPEGDTEAEREEVLFQLMAGARRALDELAITLLGGHTTTAPELVVGFHVEGLAPADLELLSQDRLAPGQTLILSKALGTGVLFRADMLGELRGPWFTDAVSSMVQANRDAAEIARTFGARAATDVTGFGLAGHLASMLRTAGIAAEIDVTRIPALPGALELLESGLRSTFHDDNARIAKGMDIDATARENPRLPLLFDPQTSGGLLFGLPKDKAEPALEELLASGHRAAIIGRTTEVASGSRIRVISSSAA